MTGPFKEASPTDPVVRKDEDSDSNSPTTTAASNKMQDSKNPSTSSKDDVLLDVVDEDAEEMVAANIDQESKVATKSDVKRSIKTADNICEFSDDPTLYLDTTELLDTEAPVNIKPEKKESVVKSGKTMKTIKPADRNLNRNRMVWVYNIKPSTKASELKMHFSKYAKITTARVVTNGKKYYGCLTVEDEETVRECVRKLNNTIMDGQEIRLMPSAPDNESSDDSKQRVKTKEPKRDKKRPSQIKHDTSTSRVRESHSKSKDKSASPTHRSDSIEVETRRKFVELRRLTEEVDRMQRRKERMIAEEKEKERDRRELERIQEMRRKMEEERAQKRLDIDLAKKKLDMERQLLEKERDAFVRIKKLEAEEIRVRSETKRKLDDYDYQRKAKSPKRFSYETKRPIRRSPPANLYQSSQKFDIKPLKREDNKAFVPPPPKLSPIPYKRKIVYKENEDTYYNPKSYNHSSSSRKSPPSKKPYPPSTITQPARKTWPSASSCTSNCQHHSTTTWPQAGSAMATGSRDLTLGGNIQGSNRYFDTYHHQGGYGSSNGGMRMTGGGQEPYPMMGDKGGGGSGRGGVYPERRY